MREESEDGRMKNKTEDLFSMSQIPELVERKSNMLAGVHEQLKKIKDRENERRRTGEKSKGVPHALLN